jgi:hypothetical protein
VYVLPVPVAITSRKRGCPVGTDPIILLIAMHCNNAVLAASIVKVILKEDLLVCWRLDHINLSDISESYTVDQCQATSGSLVIGDLCIPNSPFIFSSQRECDRFLESNENENTP